MLLKGEQLAAHLDRDLKAVYVVYGDEPLLVIEAADAIRAAARRKGFDEREVLTAISGFNWNELHLATGNMSLFGGRQLIDLRIPTGKPGREGGKAIQDYCARPSPDALLLVTLPGLDWSEEKATWLKALTEAGVAVKLIPPNLAELPAWIAGRLRRQQQKAGNDALHFIAERVEGNLLAAHQEIQKLALLYPEGELSLQQIQEAVLNVARYDLDGLREALLSGDVARLTRTLDGLQQEGEAPPLVLWAMTEEVRALAQVKAGQKQGQPVDALLKEARVWGARQSLFKRALPRIKESTANAALEDAARIDRMIKGIGGGDGWTEFLRLGLGLAGH
ncbi:MAG: DNA polymerase III subunit delta [Propionivibrio sp.]|uniref:DNA polymerase III subunit delta n=1 Tax=Propionivibrio sp. TaxID=2212460 RepID=UPI001B531B4A|nr:DNA polymerase III subunit delta [Propionivibrio sp.]MBP7204106.1 DNA polymerase III subunit delta [Propionivibrio sp.]